MRIRASSEIRQAVAKASSSRAPFRGRFCGRNQLFDFLHGVRIADPLRYFSRSESGQGAGVGKLEQRDKAAKRFQRLDVEEYRGTARLCGLGRSGHPAAGYRRVGVWQTAVADADAACCYQSSRVANPVVARRPTRFENSETGPITTVLCIRPSVPSSRITSSLQRATHCFLRLPRICR